MKTRNINPIPKLTGAFMMLVTVLFATLNAFAVGSPNVVIYELYGSGGNSGAAINADYVVLFNRGASGQNINNWSLQYSSAAGTTWTPVALATNYTIPSGGYFSVKLAGGATGTGFSCDYTNTAINMAGAGAKLALCNNNTALTGSNPVGGATVVDFVGAATANAFEGSVAGAMTATKVLQRANGGCTDTDNNGSDFSLVTIAGSYQPADSSTAIHSCGGPVIPPVISGVSPSSATANAGNNVAFTVTLSQGDTPLTYRWYKEVPGTSTNLIASATTATLTLTNVLKADQASYQVTVANASLTVVTSAVVTLSVTDPVITVQPVSLAGLSNAAAVLNVTASGTALTYQWYTGNPSPAANSVLSNGGRISGATSRSLLISPLQNGDANTYFVIVSGTYGSVTSSVAILTVTTTGAIAYWDFNAPGLDPTAPAPAFASTPTSSGLANLLPANGFIPASGLGSPGDPINSVLGATNYYWGTSTYPGTSVSNKTAGVFFKVASTGVKNIRLSFDTRPTTTTSKYQRLQYTTNGTDYLDYPTSSQFGNTDSSTWGHVRNFDLTGFKQVDNNPNFGVRIVTEFESSATYSNSANGSYVGVTNAYSTGGTLSYDIVTFTADSITNGNVVPTLSTPTSQTVPDAGSLAIAVTVGDPDGNPNDLVLSATSPEPGLSLSVSGTGAARFVNCNPSLGNVASRNIPVTVTVTDVNGDSAATSFMVTVTPLNNAPVITGLINTNMLINQSRTFTYTVADEDNGNLLTYAISSANTNLLPAANITLGGSGNIRTVAVTPSSGQLGEAPLILTVTDTGNVTTTTNFVVLVRPTTNVVFNEYFDYTNGPLNANSFSLWKISSGTGSLVVNSNAAIVDQNIGQDLYADLFGQPYVTNSTVVIYYSLKVNFSSLPAVDGSYIAHLLDKNTLGAGAQTAFGARLWASTLNAAAGTYRLTIGNGSGTTNTSGQVAMDLNTNTDYTVAVRFVPTNGLATIWINPNYETDPSITATDVPSPNTVSNSINVTSIALRENVGEGVVKVDDVRVGLTFDSVVDNLKITQSGSNAILIWQNPQFSLQSTTNLTLPFANVPGASSPFTTNINSQPQNFFRTKK